MENLELIVSLAATAASTLIACVTFIVKAVRAIRARVKSEGKTALLDAVAAAVEAAEALTNYSGAEKKAYVIMKMNKFAIENGIEFDLEAVSEKIEQLVELSKRVNKRESKAPDEV